MIYQRRVFLLNNVYFDQKLVSLYSNIRLLVRDELGKPPFRALIGLRIFSIKTTKSRKAKQRIIELPRCVKRAWSPVETQLGSSFDCRMTEKIKLSGLESFLMRIADYLRKNMEESEYKEYIFGLLFLKRMSDVFEEKREVLKKDYQHLPEDALQSILEDKTTYGETFFVPKRARWNEGWYDQENGTDVPALRDLKTDIGPMLNKALTAIEDANSEVLQGIFKDRINFNKMSVDGTPVVKNSDLRKMIEEFNNFPPLLNKNFEFPDLLGAAYEFVLKYFADSAGKKGGEFYTPNTVVRMLVKLLQVDEGMSIYDPTVGSGGMLIQSYQYIEDEGKNPKNLALYGQDNKDGVVAICKMNMIFHDIFGSHIKYGDTLVNPQHTKNGKIMKFDRVIANPPFSQKYSTEEMKYKDRFIYGFTPEDAKQADLMFVQHMLASCDENKGGRVVVVMPHGVLFRGRKEKEIRTAMLQRDVDVLEGVISLPPQLFYGTGIPACVMVFSKRKSDDMKGKVFFINADREYKEGKKQNTLRPEDIEKISYVYLNKMEVPNYSRLVDLSEIEQNGYTLNIRKYVDNTPAPEHHDVHAHLVGGVPAVEIEEINSNLSSKIHFDAFTLFSSGNDSYRHFAVNNRDEIKQAVEESSEVNAVVSQLHDNLSSWWKTASEEFATIAGHRDALLPKVRNSLMQSMRQTLEPVGMLDQHQVAGIFVNWWDGVKYDLKTIMQRKWDIDLIYPEYRDLVTAMFFANERQAIDKKQEDVANCEANIEDIVEQILESVDYEPEEPAEGEEAKEIKHTPKLAHEQLAVALKGCEEDSDDANELKAYSAQLKDCEEALKAAKSELDQLQKTLDLHLELKCLGVESKKQYVVGLLNQANNEIAEVTQHATAFLEQSGLQFCIPSEDASIETILASLDEIKKSVPSNKNKRTAEQNALLTKVAQAKDVLKEPKKKFTKLQKEVVKIQQVLSGYDATMQSIGGQITEEETRTLILQKHYNIIADQLNRYTEQEKREVIAACEHLFDKYATSAQQITADRNKVMNELNDILKKLKYVD